MALTNEILKKLIDDHAADIAQELERLRKIHRYIEGHHDQPYTPRNATDQYMLLRKRSVTNMMPMVRNAPLQQLFVDGVWAEKKTGAPVPAWDIWQANDFDRRHQQIISAALTDGYCYGLTLPGVPVPKMRGVSAKRMYALYEDPVDDLWPQYAFQLNGKGDIVGIIDNEAVYSVETFAPGVDGKTPPPQLGTPMMHNAGVCPVVRYAPDMDLDGNCYGEVEPNFQAQDRVNQTAFDLLMVQHYGAFQLRGFSGVKVAKDKNGNPVPIRLDPSITPVLEDADSKAWQLPGSPLEGHIASLEQALYHLAVSSQTPAHYLLGKLANLAADAIAAAETTLTRKVTGYKHTLGESFEQQLRLASRYAKVDFPDSAEIQWADRESRSLAQVADAVNKLIGVGVPKEALWEMLPGITQTKIEQWREMAAAQQDEIDVLAQKLLDKQLPGVDPNAQ